MKLLSRKNLLLFAFMAVAGLALANGLTGSSSTVYAETKAPKSGPPGNADSKCNSSQHTVSGVFVSDDGYNIAHTEFSSSQTLTIVASAYYCGGGQNPPHNILIGNYSKGSYCLSSSNACPKPSSNVEVDYTPSSTATIYSSKFTSGYYNANEPEHLGNIDDAGYYSKRQIGTVRLTSGCLTIKVQYGIYAIYDSQVSSNGNNPAYSQTYCIGNHDPTGNIRVTCNANGSAAISFTYSDADGFDSETQALSIATNSSTSYNSTGTYNGTILHNNGWDYHGTANSASTNRPAHGSSDDGGTVPAANTTGNLYYWLVVRDVGDNGDLFYHMVDSPTQVYCAPNEHDPTGSLTVACNVNSSNQPVYTFSYSFSDADGESSARPAGWLSSAMYSAGDYGHRLLQTDGTDTYQTDNVSPYQNSPTYTATFVNAWPGTVSGVYHKVYLTAADIHANGSHAWAEPTGADVDRPACPPGGNVTASCNSINVTNASDPDLSTHKLRVDVYEDGVAGVGKRVYSAYTGVDGSGNNDGTLTAPWQSPDNHDILHGYKDPASPTGTAASNTLMQHGVYPSFTGHNLQVYLIGINKAGVETAPNTSYPVSVGPCVHVQCNAASLGDAVAGQLATFTVSVKVTGAALSDIPPPIPPFAVSVKDAGGTPQILSPVSPVPYDPATSAGSPTLYVYSMPIKFTPTTTGQYHVQYSWLSSGLCDSYPDVGFGPYFNVKGADAVAGATIGCGSTATAVGTADIKSWNIDNKDLAGYGGAGADLAAFAGGFVQHFATSQVGSPLSTAAKLAFANSPTANFPAVNAQYGGKFKTLPCEPDYYANSAAASYKGTVPANTTISNFDTATYPADSKPYTYNVTGPLTLDLGVNKISAGQLITLRVKGNVYINSDILYDAYTLATVPRLNLYVVGNVFIAPSVHEIHGVYVAQKTSSAASPPSPLASYVSGNMTTCYDTTKPQSLWTTIAGNPETTDYDICGDQSPNGQLKIYGSVVADTVRLDRSHGSVTAAGVVPAEPAEIFQYSPELWLGGDTSCTLDPTNCRNYNGITGLPPVL